MAWLWLGLGLAFCVFEVITPTAFVELMMGISAFAVAVISLVVPQFYLQALIWLILSVFLIALVRRFVPKRTARILQAEVEAETLTQIPAGQTGRVIYEGSSWRARCEDENLTIESKTKVYVVGRKGTTLFVIPTEFGEGLTFHPKA
ncbi:NfeD family protein [Acaryochloris sp. CCMEE 5410]|uniref:NfeD family protein n=1 Tax=Acaryochloris sp. CCMEE 5410 TaxID=310037 RepID=UPI0002485335|nr:NfeD family protein [Acaryochloris sp. CCMEE 5410]KAI9133779.1 NfeD family protein [Acaryochloris sp. CCMEE 5410]